MRYPNAAAVRVGWWSTHCSLKRRHCIDISPVLWCMSLRACSVRLPRSRSGCFPSYPSVVLCRGAERTCLQWTARPTDQDHFSLSTTYYQPLWTTNISVYTQAISSALALRAAQRRRATDGRAPWMISERYDTWPGRTRRESRAR